ncbi:MAG TPA: putative lipid II flippase FtsW [Candidatus Paceibacterota bacterium]|nr:putative lipid II flippase FtsW [Candidatus Paceibacterota bacterium]
MKRLVKKLQLKPFDRYFFGIIALITVVGLFSFVSASLGILARNEKEFYGVLFNQIVLGFVGGYIGLWIVAHIPYTFWKRYAFYIFVGTLVLTILVFVPHLGFAHGGAQRWLSLGPLSFQPAEFLKIGFIIYFATWLAWTQKKHKEGTSKLKVMTPLILLGIVAAVLLKQPDTKSLILITIAACSMFFVSGVSWKKVLIVIGIGAVGIIAVAFVRPYVMQRIKTYLKPSNDPQGSSYQLQQSLIAIGSGGIFGRGLGQSVQKFNYLPEPQGDSIFAVIGEEFGFIGSCVLVVLYIFLTIRGYKIAMQAPDNFSQYLVVGIMTLIIAQSFLNIASLVGLFPLTGVPLVFISHGGTSLFITLCAIGIVLNVSRYQKRV